MLSGGIYYVRECHKFQLSFGGLHEIFFFFYFIADGQLHLRTAFMVYLYLLVCYGDCKLHFVVRFNTKFLRHWHLQPNNLCFLFEQPVHWLRFFTNNLYTFVWRHTSLFQCWCRKTVPFGNQLVMPLSKDAFGFLCYFFKKHHIDLAKFRSSKLL